MCHQAGYREVRVAFTDNHERTLPVDTQRGMKPPDIYVTQNAPMRGEVAEATFVVRSWADSPGSLAEPEVSFYLDVIFILMKCIYINLQVEIILKWLYFVALGENWQKRMYMT